MKGYVAFVKKEWMEAVRTYKVLLMGIVFLLLGIMNPLTAKLLPVIFEQINMEGMTITLGTVGAKDSWEQFYKNVPQMGLILLVIMFSGMMSNEFGKGTIIPMLAKGLKRDAVILSKFTISAGLWTVSYLICVAVSFGYTRYFWPADHMMNMAVSLGMVWLFGIFLLALMLLMGTITKRMAGTLLGTGGVVVLLFLISLIPKAEVYNPISLISVNMGLLLGSADPAHYMGAVIITCGMALLSLIGACAVFRKQAV